MVALAVMPGPEWVEVLLEVRGPEGLPARELAEEIIDGLRFAILSDRRLRLRGEDRPMPREIISELTELLAKSYLGHSEEVHLNEGNGKTAP
jgi:hypothetical protein